MSSPLRARLAGFLLPALGGIMLVPVVTAPVALGLGLTAALVLGNPYRAATKKLTTPLLQIAVVGLGAGMNLGVVVEAGRSGFLYTMVGIALTLALAALLRRLLAVPRDVGVLVGVGTAICGGSAIAAVAPAIGASDDDVAVSLGVVFLLNAVGLFLFPWAGHLLHLGEGAFGLWAALAIHDTSSVVGAASQYGPHALSIATVVKLARALWILPLSFVFALLRRKGAGGGKSGAKVPWFVFAFLLVAAAFTYLPLYAPVLSVAGPLVARGARQLLVLTLFVLGANVTRETLKAAGARPLLLGVLLWVLAAGASLAIVRFTTEG